MAIPPDELDAIKRRIAEIVAQMDAIPVSLYSGLSDQWQILLAELTSLGQRLMDNDTRGDNG